MSHWTNISSHFLLPAWSLCTEISIWNTKQESHAARHQPGLSSQERNKSKWPLLKGSEVSMGQSDGVPQITGASCETCWEVYESSKLRTFQNHLSTFTMFFWDDYAKLKIISFKAQECFVTKEAWKYPFIAPALSVPQSHPPCSETWRFQQKEEMHWPPWAGICAHSSIPGDYDWADCGPGT